jgi:hypothetical protein
VIRAISLLLSPAIAIVLLAGNLGGQLGLIEMLLGILAIIGFAIVATGWTIDHDVSE